MSENAEAAFKVSCLSLLLKDLIGYQEYLLLFQVKQVVPEEVEYESKIFRAVLLFAVFTRE